MTPRIRVGIALVESEGRYLVRQRPHQPGSPMPGFWEFPGGKCEADEPPAEAAVRECWEESGLRVWVRALRRAFEHHYPHGLVQLHYFDCVVCDQAAEPEAGTGFRWIPVHELSRLTFPEANDVILHDLARSGEIDE
jgi:mutator protein MutT